MNLTEISSLIDLATLAANQEDETPDISTCSNCLLDALDSLPGSNPAVNLVPVAVALQQLQMFRNIPQELSLRQVAAVLQPATEQLAGISASLQEQLVRLDALVGLVCLLAAGDVSAKLQLCFDALLARNGSSSLSLPQLLAMLPGLKLTAAAAQLILRQETPQSLAAQQSSKDAQADWQQRQQVLAEVLTAAFQEADSTGAGALQPGVELQQLLFSAAEQLAAIIVGGAPAPAANSATAAALEQGTIGYQDADSAWASKAADAEQQQQMRQESRLQQNGVQTFELRSQAQQQQPYHQQQRQPGPSQGDSQQQPQQQQASSPAQADVVIMDDAGGCIHFTTTVEEAAAAAAAGRPPRRSSDALHVYQARQQGGAPELTSAASLTRHLSEQLEAQQQHQQLQQLRQPLHMQGRHSSASNDSSMFYSPMQSEAGSMTSAAVQPLLSAGQSPTAVAAAGSGRSLSGPAARHRLSNSAVSKRLLSKLQRVTADDGMGAVESEEQQPEQQQGQAAAGGEAAGGTGPGPTEALTTTAGNLARAVQSNVAAASARVLVHCSVCFLLTTMVALGDAALVAGLHAGAGLPLSVSFGIAVGANLALVLLLFAALLLVRCLNRSSDRVMSEALTAPQVQQLDELLKNISTAVTLLKQSEQQPAGAQQPAALRTGGNATGTGTHTHLPRSSSSTAYRDMEEGAAGADAAGNFALSDKFRTVWSTVGRVAGFLPPVDGLGHQESLQSPHALPSTLVMHSTFSTTSGEASPHIGSLHHQQMANQAAGSGELSSVTGAAGSGAAAGGYRAAAARQLGGGQSERHVAAAGAAGTAAGAPAAGSGYQQSRSGRALGSSGGTGSLPGIFISEVYPNV